MFYLCMCILTEGARTHFNAVRHLHRIESECVETTTATACLSEETGPATFSQPCYKSFIAETTGY